MSAKGVVATGHELTAAAAVRMLAEGGNAFDAILAAMCAACVTEPVLASLGGGGFLLARTASGDSEVYDFFAQTPHRKRPVGELDFHPIVADFGFVQQEFHIGLGAVATPGVVRGLFEIHRRLGSLPMRVILAPAIEHARDGVEINQFQAYVFRIVAPIYTVTPEARALYGSAGNHEAPAGGAELLRQPELAQLLELLSREGDEPFYRGDVARSIVEQCRDGGGHLGAEDLEQYRVICRPPLTVDYRGCRLMTNPPPASGGTLVGLALKMLESLADLRGTTFGSSRHLELLGRALAGSAAANVEARLRDDAAADANGLDAGLLRRYRDEILDRPRSHRGTTHMNVMDAAGNVASLTLSNGEGCGHLVPGTGIMLNNMLGEDDLSPHGFHLWEPDRRMTSMMSPTLLRHGDGRFVATGSGGSKRIRSSILQVLVNLIDFGMGVEEAVAAPRIAVEDDRLSVEPGFDPSALELLIERFPRHELWQERNLYFGGAHIVERDGESFQGAGDKRRGGVCVSC